MTREYTDLIYLTACLINDSIPDKDQFDEHNLDRLFRAAEYQQLTSITSCALQKAGISDERFEVASSEAIFKQILHDEDRERITSAFENAGIWYMPLKGVVIKDLYPYPDLRQMADNDILFDASRAADVRGIMEELGYETVHFNTGHQDDYCKLPALHFEMHRKLFDSTLTLFYRYFNDIKSRLIRVEGREYEYCFSQEDFYVYLIAHLFKHYYWEGVGLKSLLDVYVYLRHYSQKLDWDYLDAAFRDLGIEAFEKRTRALASKTFLGKSLDCLTKKEKKMLDQIILKGDFTTFDETVNDPGVLKQFLHRSFLPLEAVKVSYPSFYKYRVLIPFLPVYRLTTRWGRAKAEIKSIIRRR